MKRSGLYVRIWDVVRKIPVGRVVTYGQVARMAGLGNQARLVGYALHQLPEDTDVPWYRVVNAKGCISLSKIDSGYYIQKAFLEAEGVEFIEDKIDLDNFRWEYKGDASDEQC